MFKNNMFKNKKEMLKTEKETFKIMYKTVARGNVYTKSGYENAANHFMGLEHSYPDRKSAIRAYTFLKKDSPRCIFIILGNRDLSDKGRYL